MSLTSETPAKPWLNEPDSIDFLDEATELPVAMRRGPHGGWCAYVGVTADHPWYGKSYNASVSAPKALIERPASPDEIGIINLFCASQEDIDQGIMEIVLLVRCHGGLTYSAAAPGGSSDPDERASWWFGFDCAHSGDLSPKYGWSADDVYRDSAYVRESAAKAAADLCVAAQANTIAEAA